VIYVLDASAMIAYLRAENGGDHVRDVLFNSNNQTYAHVLNLWEVYYDFYRSDDPETALQAIRDLEF
jgi:PIN domain nuclease of toxin-antitoxin system